MLGTVGRKRNRPDDGIEVFGFQTRAPYEGAADFQYGKKLMCIGRIDRTAIENSDLLAWSAEAPDKTLPDVDVHLHHLFERGRVAGSDGPERFVPNRIDGHVETVWYASGNLIGAYSQRLASAPLRLRFTNAYNREKTADARGFSFGGHHGVGFAVMLAPL
jgi:hypothetical protein